MKKTRKRLGLKAEVVRQLDAVWGGQAPYTVDIPCASVGCPTYKEITCVSNLGSCLTGPNGCP